MIKRLVNIINPLIKQVFVLSIKDNNKLSLLLLEKRKNQLNIKEDWENITIDEISDYLNIYTPLILVFDNNQVIESNESKQVFETDDFINQSSKTDIKNFVSYIRVDYVNTWFEKLKKFIVSDIYIGSHHVFNFKDGFKDQIIINNKVYNIETLDASPLEATIEQDFYGVRLTGENVLPYIAGTSFIMESSPNYSLLPAFIQQGKESLTYLGFIKKTVAFILPIVLTISTILFFWSNQLQAKKQDQLIPIENMENELEANKVLKDKQAQKKQVIDNFSLDFSTSYSSVLDIIGKTTPKLTAIKDLQINPIIFNDDDIKKTNKSLTIKGFTKELAQLNSWTNQLKDSLQLESILFRSFNSEEQDINFIIEGSFND